MSKPHTVVEFSNQITSDRTWRLREISHLRSLTERAEPQVKPVLLRSLITMSYAHWEGYVRFAAEKYMQHVSLKRLPYERLDRQFRRNLFLPRLAALSKNKTNIEDRCALIDSILDSAEKRFSRVPEVLIQTKSNLNSEVFCDICIVCGIDHASFEDRFTFIDVFLLKRRNSIAHGEDTFVDIGDLIEVTNGTVELMRLFGDALENAVALERYRPAATIP